MKVFIRGKGVRVCTSYFVLLVFMLTSLFMVSPAVMAGSGTVQVSNSTELAAALSAAQPGDCIVLADGNYSGLVIQTQGTAENPVEIRAANPGKAVFNTGVIHLQGANHIVLNGLKITTNGVAKTIDDKSRTVAVYLEDSNDCRITCCTLSLASPGKGTEWIFLYGNSNRNRIDHCEFGPFAASGGHYIFPSGKSTIDGYTNPNEDRTDWANYNSPFNPNVVRDTLIDHNYFHDNAASETICLGGAGVAVDYQNTNTIIEYNLFVNCDGDAEIIATKSSGNTIRYNTVRTSVGMFSLRSGNKNAIYGNFFFQENKPGAGGIKLYEKDHKVYNNYIDSASEYPILIGSGDAYNGGSFSHAQVYRAQVVNNTVVNLNNRPVIIGHGSNLPPVDCVFANNIITGNGAKLMQENVTSNIAYVNNVADGTLGISASSNQFLMTDPLLTTVDGIQKLWFSSPAINYANQGYSSFVTEDIDGQPRDPYSMDVGADEYTSGPVTNRPLAVEDVGPYPILHTTPAPTPVPTPTPTPAPANLALNKTYSESTAWKGNVSGYGALKAFDGNYTSTRWSADDWKTNPKPNQWIAVNFGASTTYNSVTIRESGQNVKSFKLQASDDGNAYTDIYTGTTIGTSISVDFAPVTSKYLRLFIMNTEKIVPSIYEVAVYNVPKTSVITPVSAEFDKNPAKQSNIPVTVIFNGNTLSTIKNRDYVLTNNDYTVTGSVIDSVYGSVYSSVYTIKKEFLSTLRVGVAPLTFAFSQGNPSTLKINLLDTTPPSLVAPKDLTVEATGLRTLVDIGTAAVDKDVMITNDAPKDFPLGKTVVTWTSTNRYWITSTAIQTITVADTTPPVITGSAITQPNGNGWYNCDVIVHFVASDSVTGIATVTSDTTIATEGASQAVKGAATDKAGNTSSIEVGNINIDKTAPVITVTAPTSDSLKTSDSLVVNYTVTDNLSGVESAEATLNGEPVKNRDVINLASKAGSNVLEVTATDKAGNSTVKKVMFDVVIDATVNISPETLNVKSHGGANSITVHVKLPTGYEDSLINAASIKMNINGTLINAELSSNEAGNPDNDIAADLIVKFDRQKVIAALGDRRGDVTLLITGMLEDGRNFAGTDRIKVIQ